MNGYGQSSYGKHSFGGPAATPPEAVQCACNIDLRDAGIVKAFDVRGWGRAAIQAELESGDWDGSSVGADDGTIGIYRSVNGRDYDAASPIATIGPAARIAVNLNPRGCAFLVAAIGTADQQTGEARVKLTCSGVGVGVGTGGGGGLVSLIAAGSPVVF